MTHHMAANDDLWFLLLRAINTGRRRLTNEELLAPLAEAGYTDAAAYQAAGNIAFRSAASVDGDELSELLSASYGFDTPVFVRSAEQVRSLIDRCPFDPSEIEETEGKVQVALLRRPPTEAQIDEVAAITPDDDRVAFDGMEWFWLPVAGVSDSALPVAAIERIVGPMTMRTLGTLERMLKKFVR